MHKFILITLFVFILVSNPILAVDIENPQKVSHMEAKLLQSGSVTISGEGTIKILEINISIPQEDEFQEVEISDVSHEYKIVKDEYGNSLLTLILENPINIIDYYIESHIVISRRTKATSNYEFTRPTDLINIDENEITKISQEAKGTNFEKISYLSKWIKENIVYNKKFSDVSLTSLKVLQRGEGVCDEFSNLLLSFTRSLGYSSGFIAGYVYSKNETTNLEAHSWNEIYVGDGIPSDPTWAEVGYIDATHIKFATLPDSLWNYITASVSSFGNVNIDLSPVETTINVIDVKEDDMIEMETELLSPKVGRGGYNVIKTDFSYDGCVLLELKILPCIYDDGEFLELLNEEKYINLCGSVSHFSLFKILDRMEDNMIYTCPVKVNPTIGKEQVLDVIVNSKDVEADFNLIVDKTTLIPKESFYAEADAFLFTDTGISGNKILTGEAPFNDFMIYAYRDGSLKSQKVEVKSYNPFEITVDATKNFTVGTPNTVEISIKNKLNEDKLISLKLNKISKDILIKGKETKDLQINITPSDINDNVVQIKLESDDYSITMSKSIKIIQTEDEGIDIISKIIKLIIDIINYIKDIFM